MSFFEPERFMLAGLTSLSEIRDEITGSDVNVRIYARLIHYVKKGGMVFFVFVILLSLVEITAKSVNEMGISLLDIL